MHTNQPSDPRLTSRRDFLRTSTALAGAAATLGPLALERSAHAAANTPADLAATDRLSPDRVPSWAQTGRFRYARWDGGIIEAAKGFLSGWPSWREPDQLLAVANWCEPSNVELVEMGHLNWIWVTFSNGFSLESERPHQQRLQQFIAACRRRGIHVTAYMSISNMFSDDMFAREPRSKNWVALGKEGKPVPYGAADYSGFTSVTRYLACLRHPEWREYLKRRIERVIAAGGEGVMWDNAAVGCYCPRCESGFAAWRAQTGAPDEAAARAAHRREFLAGLVAELHAHAQRLKPDFLMYVNCNRGFYTVNRAGNAVSTEDGIEPGVTAEGKVVSNIGKLRCQWAVGEGWRPVRMEYGAGRLRKGPFESRFTVPMTPRSHQLAIAEAAAHHVGFALFSEGHFQRDVFLRQPAALDNLRAVGRYNAFLKRHEGFYLKPRSLAQVALLANDDDRQVQASHELGDRGAIFDVVFTSSLTVEQLSRYQVLVAPDVRCLSDTQVELLAQRAERGGRVVLSGEVGACDERFRKRERTPLARWFALQDDQVPDAGTTVARGTGSFVYGGPVMDWDTLAASLAGGDPAPLMRVEAPRTVRFNVHGQETSARWLLHLLNYAAEPVQRLKVSVGVPATKVTVLTPDRVLAGKLKFAVVDGRTEFVVPALDIYALVVVQPQAAVKTK